MKVEIFSVILAVTAGIAYGYPSYTAKDVPTNCVWCQMIVFVAQEQLVKIAPNEKVLEMEMMGVCLKVINATICKKYIPSISQYLWEHEQESPKKVCTRVNLCPQTERLYGTEFTPPLSVNDTLINEKGAPVDCAGCQRAVNLAEEEILKKLTNETASEVPGWVELLRNLKNAPRKRICELTRFCPASELPTDDWETKPTLDLHKLFGNSSRACQFCHDLLTFVKHIAQQYEIEIENLVIKYFCSSLPDLPRKRCNIAVKEDIPKIIDNLNVGALCNVTTFC